MSNEQPEYKHSKKRSPTKLVITFGAGLIAAVPLFNLAGMGMEKLVGLGKIQSTVEMQAKLISDLQSEKKNLAEKAEKLQVKSHDLEMKLSNSDASLAMANLHVAQLSKDLNEYKIATAQLGQRVKAIDPCLSIQGQIADVEKQLAVDPPWSHALKGARREEAMIQLEKHQQSLRACLSRNS
ncbi:hypothetical protein [Pseudomonas atacamensis]|uniref:hypothetical protein n=1 Tax=Pseudomonas atacamensis TaxID=2565368 RepID=UPI00300F1ED9